VTVAPEGLLAARRLLLEHLDMHPGRTVDADLDPAEVGVIGDTAHAAGGDSYHLGKDQIIRSGHRYSVDESPRDARGLSIYASAMDVGWFEVSVAGKRWTLRDFSVWLVAQCKAGVPDTRDIREIIYSPDGRTVKRWDRLAKSTTGDDSHRWHTHISEFRDARGRHMPGLIRRWLTHIALIPEDDMPLSDTDIDKVAAKVVPQVVAGVWGKQYRDHNLPNPDGTVPVRTTGALLYDARTDAWRARLETAALHTVLDKLAGVIAAGGGSVDVAAIRRAVKEEVRDAVADFGEGGAAALRNEPEPA